MRIRASSFCLFFALGLVSVSAQAVPTYSVNPGIVGSDISFDIIPIETGVDPSVAFEGRVMFDAMKHVELSSAYVFRLIFEGTDVQQAIDFSFGELLTLLDENSAPISGPGTSTGAASATDFIDYGWQENSQIDNGLDPSVTIHGFAWLITPNFFPNPSLPATLDISFIVFDQSDFFGDAEGILVGEWAAVPEPSTLTLIAAGLLGLYMRRKRVA